MTAKTSISLTDQQYAFAKAQVDAGRYSSVSAVLQQALERMREEAEEKERFDAMLKELILRRMEETPISGEEMDRRLKLRFAKERRALGLEG